MVERGATENLRGSPPDSGSDAWFWGASDTMLAIQPNRRRKEVLDAAAAEAQAPPLVVDVERGPEHKLLGIGADHDGVGAVVDNIFTVGAAFPVSQILNA